MRHWTPRAGDVVAIRDQRLRRWRRATVVSVNPFLRLFTAKAGNIWFSDEIIHPRFIRPVQLVYCSRCSEMRRAA